MSDDEIEVVSGIAIRDGCVLCGQRLSTCKNLPNGWEFPGGKVENGESHYQALERELREELGIVIQGNLHLISTEVVTYTKTYRIYFYLIEDFVGQATAGDSHQRIEWVPFEQMANHPFDQCDRRAWNQVRWLE